jgi:predicted permease
MANDLRFALRMILSHRWFSAAVVSTLALGIGLNTMVFTLINAVLFKPLPVPNGSRLVAINERNTGRDDFMRISYPDFLEFRAQSRSFEWLEAGTDEGGAISEPGNPPQSYHLSHASAGVFGMLETRALMGRELTRADELAGAEPVVVIGYKVWQERYGRSPGALGRAVRVNGKPATIVGVMPEGFRFPTGVDLWMPLQPNEDLNKRDNRGLLGYGILKQGASVRQASTELDAIAARLARQYPENKDVVAQVMTFNQRFNGGPVRLIFLMMLGAVGLVLLIACADVANMMLSRALGRTREMGIRTALGASRWRVVRQLLIESLMLSVLGGALGLGLAWLGVHWFDLSTAVIRPYWIEFTMNYTVLGYFSGLCVLAALLFGTVPALRSSRPDLVEELKEGGRSMSRQRGGWLASTLVVFQFALTLVLLTGAGFFVRTLLAKLEMNPFVPSTEVYTGRVELPEARYADTNARLQFYDRLLPRLRAIPGVRHAALVGNPPGQGAMRQQMELEHQPVAKADQRPWIAVDPQSPGYMDVIHLPLLRGRDFNGIDGSDSHEAAVVTRAAAEHFWPGQDPLGKRFRVFDDKNKPSAWITVVGVSGDMIQEANETDPRPLFFVPWRQLGWDNMALVMESATDPIPAVRATVQSLDQDMALTEVYREDAAIEHQTWFLRVIGKVFLGFAIIALLMASVGIYAVMSHATSRRTREIGVRIALGATTRNILALAMSRGLWQIAAGVAIGLLGGIPVARLMKSLPIGFSTDPTLFPLVAGVMTTVGLFACWLPARRALKVDPVKAMRTE